MGFCANAQKLPNVQQVSLRMPANIKIDGKLTEWGPKLKAHNTATDVDYTLANDDKNLYLALRTTEYFVIENILKHGVRFTINHSISKKDELPVIVTYPAMEFKDKWSIIERMASRFFENSRKVVDNSDKAINSLLQAKSKFIKVVGISDIADKEIPLYNDKGIVAMSTLQNSAYVYELAIPLKYLALNGSNAASFSYQIKINYPDNEKRPPSPPAPTGIAIVELQPVKVSVAVTDFWGEYTLAK